ncbi:HD-GYP domain-containing protein [Pseudalkalibacillus hwajinpoensis]|uniref:HD-GYP domain-containing protein n=1 Tax=Guptibacillus hwajinpoensis TaxID=208199 RepID=UPI001CFD4998|nr:HD domain-containing phosphohydrolase [Pseudalkalibacillus hwajinpoensis]
MKKCTLHGHTQLFTSQSLRLMELLRRHDSHCFHHSVQSTSYFIDFCLYYHFHSLLKPRILQSVLLHDIGNLLVTKEILHKNGPLTLSEKKELEQHPELGLELLSDYPEIEIEPSLILHHHENRDGTGYPDRMHSDQLPFAVKVLGLIDSYTAMTMERPYRPKRSDQSAVDEIIQNQYVDASCTSLFVAYMEKRLKGKRILLHYLDYVPSQK